MTSFTLTGILLALALAGISIFGWMCWQSGYHARIADERYEVELGEWEEAA